MISPSCAPSIFMPASFCRTMFFQSDIIDSCNAPDGVGELLPALALRRENLTALHGEAKEAAPSLACLLAPPPADPSTPFQAVEQGIERRDVKPQPAFRTR